MANIDTIEDFKTVCELTAKFLVYGGVRTDLPNTESIKARQENRRIGLGLMGIHEWLLKRNKKYEVDAELESWLKVYKEYSEIGANDASNDIGIMTPRAYRAIAPTGTIGILSSTTTGIEPLYAVAYKRRYLDGPTWKFEYVINPIAHRMIEEYGIDPDNIETASALAKDPERRIKFQADVQKYVDMGISSTINLPQWGTEFNNEDTAKALAKTLALYARELRGITCYPDTARAGQPLTPVSYKYALSKQNQVFEENQFVCKGGVCGE
jgi:ribonucleoside-diphosphate reductase alpha chain